MIKREFWIKENPIVSCIFLLAILRGVILVFLIPPFQTPDEQCHYDYAIFLSKISLWDFIKGQYKPEAIGLRAVVTDEVSKLLEYTEFAGIPFHYERKVRTSLRESIVRAEYHQNLDSPESLRQKKKFSGSFNYPPLYYLLQSVLLRLADAFNLNIVIKFLLARFVNLGLFIATLLTALLTLQFLHFHKYVAVIIFSLIALQPELAMLSISIQPDNLVLLLITLSLYFAFKFVRHLRHEDFFYFHIISGLLLLVKIHFFIPLYLPVVFVLLVLLLRRERRLGKVGRLWAGGLGILLVTGGWWYIRSALIFQNFIGLVCYEPAGASFSRNVGEWLLVLSPLVFQRFWGEWGWIDYRYPMFVYYIFLFLSVVPAVFWLICLKFSWRKSREALFAPQKSPMGERLLTYAILTLPPLVFFLEMIVIAGMVSAESNNQGRTWLPFMLSIAVYLGGFFEHMNFAADGVPPSLKRPKITWIASAYAALFIALNIYMMYLTHQRYYG